MTLDELNVIAARADAATAGPWEVEWDGDSDENGTFETHWPWRIRTANGNKSGNLHDDGVVNLAEEETTPEDADFIAAARTDVPALVAENRLLRVLLAWRESRIPPYNDI